MGDNNVERFLNGTIHYFKLIGFEFQERHQWMKVILIAGAVNMTIVILGQVTILPFLDLDLQEKTAAISYLNYYIVSTGKLSAWLYNQNAIREVVNEFRQVYPSVRQAKECNFSYLKTYQSIERILVIFFQSISLFFNFTPLIWSLLELLRFGVFGYKVALLMWYPIDIHSYWAFYAVAYVQQTWSSYESAIIILATDLCLFSSLLQLCMHFDMINRNILKIEPDASDKAEKQLKLLIDYHQMVLRLADKVNNIFTPSVLFSLLSSSFIICFTGYQLLGDISLIIRLKAIFVLGYEMKQVVIICFLGDRLIEISLKTSDAIYEHKWYNGTSKYKRMVLIVLVRSQKRAALSIGGISDVSRKTLREVISISYQVFTILKTA